MKNFSEFLIFIITFLVLLILMIGALEFNLPNIPRDIDYLW